MNSRPNRWIHRTLALALFVPLFAAAFAPPVHAAAATASATTTSPIADAQKLYDSAHFKDAVDKLRAALSNGLVSGSDAVSARALMARAMVKAGNRVEAKQAFKAVLRTDPAYRLDALEVPPDEMDVFKMALAEITQEQIEAGQRVPASLGFFYGVGSGDNKSVGELVKAGGGDDHLKSKPEFGVSVRFPVRPKLSLDLELSRFRSTGNDSFPSPNDTRFEATAIPMVASLYWTAIPGSKHRVNVFVGAGPMVASRASLSFNFFTVRLNLAEEKVGAYLHGGVEGEWLLSPRLSLNGRVLGRYAKASKLFKDSELTLYSNAPLKNRDVDFSGFGAYVGLRAYIGY